MYDDTARHYEDDGWENHDGSHNYGLAAPQDMDYNYSQQALNEDDRHGYPSETSHYGVSAEDWNEASKELAHLGLSGSHELGTHPSRSYDDLEDPYHHQQDHRAHHYSSQTSFYDTSPSSNYNSTLDDRPEYSTDFTSIHSSNNRHSEDDLCDTLHPSIPGRWSSDHDPSHSSSIYSPGRSGYDQGLPDSDLNTHHLNLHNNYSNHDAYLSSDRYKEDEELYDDPLRYGQGDQTRDFQSSLDSDHKEYTPSLRDNLYQDDSHHTLYQDNRNHSSYDSSDRILADGYSPPNFGSNHIDPFTSSSHYSEGPYELGDSANYDPDRSDRRVAPELQSDSNRRHHHHHHDRNEDCSSSPYNNDFVERSSFRRRSLFGDHADPPVTFREDPYEASISENIDNLYSQNSSPQGVNYSSHQIPRHEHHGRLTPQGFSLDRLHLARDPASTSRAHGHDHKFSDGLETLSQMRSEVDRAMHESFNDHHHHHGHLRTNDPSHAAQREDIERMRAQLDHSTLRDLTPQLSPQWGFSHSRDPISSLSGRQSPHSKSFSSPFNTSMNTFGTNTSLDVSPPRPRTPLSAASGRRSPHFNSARDPWSSRSGRQSPHSNSFMSPLNTPMNALGTHINLDISPTRSRTPLSVASGRSPYSSSTRDPWSSSKVSMIPRTPSVTGFRSGRNHAIDPLAAHDNSLRQQLHEISNLTHEIRRSEQAHQQELAHINEVSTKLAQQSLTDSIRQADAAYQRELSLVNQQALQTQHSLDRDVLRNQIDCQRDLALLRQQASQFTQQSIIHEVREDEIFRELDQQRRLLDLQRAELSRKQDKIDSQAELSLIDRQLRAIDRQREIDSNRKLANLTRFGNLPSVLKGNYGGRPLAPPYLQQSRLLSAMRRWSDRDKSRQSDRDKSRHESPIVYDHIDAYYSLMSDHLPKHLPMFQDPYYRHGYLSNPSTKTKLGSTPSTRFGAELRMGNPFDDGIDYDYGFGRVGLLGLKHEKFAREQAYMLDDLYLYEFLLRLDQSIDELERQRRWKARLRWEEWKDARSRVEAWNRMSTHERKSLGLGEGSYWASNLFGIPLDSRFGYATSLSSHRYRPNDLRSHYTLTPNLLSRYPMWTRGGLGLGRRISNWLDSSRNPTHHAKFNPQNHMPRDYPKRGGLAMGPKLISPNLLGGSHHRRYSAGLGTTTALSQHLPPLKPLLRTPSLTNGLSKVPSSLSTRPTGHTTAPNLGSSSKAGSTSLNKPSHKTSTSAPSGPTTQTKGTGSVKAVTNASKNSPGTNGSKADGASMITKKPVPLRPGAALTPSHHSTPASRDQQPSVVAAGRPRTPRGTSKKEHPISRSTTPTVVFNPRVTAVPPESESDPPLIPRPPSRSSIKPPSSVLKPHPSSSRHQNTDSSVSVSHLDDQRLDLITKINTERNKSTPAPPED